MTAGSSIKPRPLRYGDTIGIVSPSWFGGASYIPRAQRGINVLESLGFKVKVGKHAFNNHGSVSDSAANRVNDLHDMFSDDEVAAIICTIGGDHSCHVLPLLDWELITSHPKIFIGFSDIAVLNVAIWARTGLVTFNGPTLLTDWAEFPEMPDFSLRSALGVVSHPHPFSDLPTSDEWTEEFLDWETGKDLTRRRKHQQSEGWRWLRAGIAEGPLVGGCVESLQHLRGSPYWPDLAGAILFLETSELRPLPETIDGILMDYQNMGELDKIAGLLFARPYGLSQSEKARLWEVVRQRTEPFGFPVVGNLDFGHTTPMLTLPIGVRACIDGHNQGVSIVEAAVEE